MRGVARSAPAPPSASLCHRCVFYRRCCVFYRGRVGGVSGAFGGSGNDAFYTAVAAVSTAVASAALLAHSADPETRRRAVSAAMLPKFASRQLLVFSIPVATLFLRLNATAPQARCASTL